MNKFFLMMALASLSIIANAQSTTQISSLDKKQLSELVKGEDSGLVVINFWATFCKPCVAEIPGFMEVLAMEKNKDVKIKLVSLDLKEEFPNDIIKFIDKKGYKGQFFWLSETNANIFCPIVDKSWTGSIPSTLFVNKSKGIHFFVEDEIEKEKFEEYVERFK